MHILVMPSERFVAEDNPVGGIFQRDQALALHRAGLRIGVLAAAPRPWGALRRKLTGWPSGIEVGVEQGIAVYRYQGWNPVRGHVRVVTPIAWSRGGRMLFDRYVREQGKPDLLHAHNSLFAGYLAVRLGQEHGIPVVVTEHSTRVALGMTRPWEDRHVLRTLRSSRARIFVSSALGRALEARYGDAAIPWQMIPNILDRLFEVPLREPEVSAAKGDRLRILNVAGLVPRKNHSVLLRAFARAFSTESGVELRIAGDGPLRSQLQREARGLGIGPRVVFLGEVERDKVLREMQACDLFALSSDYETFGVVLIEALACGRPVVSTRCGGPEDVVHDGNGLLVPVGDVEALAQALREIRASIARYGADDVRRDCLGRFGEQAVVGKLTGVYRQLLCPNAPGGR